MHVSEQSIERQVFTYKELKQLEITMFGKHQLENAVMAVEVANVLREKGYDIPGGAIKEGLKVTQWPGRTEVLSKEPIFILDGAHNQDGINTLIKSLKTFFKGENITFIYGAHTNKDYESMIKTVAPIAKKFITFTPNYHNGVCGLELAEEIKNYCSEVIGKISVEEAIIESLISANKNDVICVIGTLFCIKEVRDFFQKNKHTLLGSAT